MLVISLGALIFAAGVYMYLYHDTLMSSDHAVVARSSVAQEGQREKQSKDILALASSTAPARARLASFFVPADDAVAFIQAMESVGASSGASVSIASIAQGSTDGKGIGSLTAHIVISGSWTEVMKAVELFEVLPYKASIDHLTLDTSIGAGDRASSARSWQATFDIIASTLK